MPNHTHIHAHAPIHIYIHVCVGVCVGKNEYRMSTAQLCSTYCRLESNKFFCVRKRNVFAVNTTRVSLLKPVCIRVNHISQLTYNYVYTRGSITKIQQLFGKLIFSIKRTSIDSSVYFVIFWLYSRSHL